MHTPPDFHNRLWQLADALSDSYRAHKHTQHLGGGDLPDRQHVGEIITLFLDLLYPGFFDRRTWKDGAKDGGTHGIHARLSKLAPTLHAQIGECLRYDLGAEARTGAAAADKRAGEIAMDLLAKLPALRKMLADDVQAAYDGDPAARNLDEPILCYPGIYAVTIHRLAHELYSAGVPLMPRMMSEHAHSLTGIDIHPGAVIGRNFFIDHGTGVVIGETSVIGDGCKLYQGVTLGALSFPKDERGRIIRGTKRHPTLQDNVTIYSNASVLGGDTVIGEGAVIGGGVFVTASVPPHTVVKGTYEVKLSARTGRGAKSDLAGER